MNMNTNWKKAHVEKDGKICEMRKKKYNELNNK